MISGVRGKHKQIKIVYKILMNNTIVRRRADVCFSENVIIEILTREVVFNLNCSEQINVKHTILTICGIRIKLIIPDCHSGDAGGLPAYRSKKIIFEDILYNGS